MMIIALATSVQARLFEAMYRVAAWLDLEAEAVSLETIEAHTGGFSDVDRRAVVLMLKTLNLQRTAGTEALIALEEVGAANITRHASRVTLAVLRLKSGWQVHER